MHSPQKLEPKFLFHPAVIKFKPQYYERIFQVCMNVDRVAGAQLFPRLSIVLPHYIKVLSGYFCHHPKLCAPRNYKKAGSVFSLINSTTQKHINEIQLHQRNLHSSSRRYCNAISISSSYWSLYYEHGRKWIIRSGLERVLL